ncbi:dTDP-4-amino-4,6-dideoxygalactose transaminase [Flavobacteriales bacterium]|nr:dTDP-4-amino-4,6-dideoxygalactose transaminase [Flavobacteriales bacterium]
MIPFNRSSLEGKELEYIMRSVLSGAISGDQGFSHRSEAKLSEFLNGAPVKLTTSCTHALEICALLLDIQPGDEVIVPSYTFVSTASAFALRGANIVFADSRPDTLNLDETLLPDLITGRTKAIVVVHYGGVACEMDTINAIAEKHGVTVIEDNAHGLFGKYKGRPLGTLGRMATQSFHETKNITCGEGGAIVLNDTSLVEAAEIIREKGTDRSQFFRGQVDKYSWKELGSSYVMSDILGAYLLGQLDNAANIQAHRHRVWNHYAQNLENWAADKGIQLPSIPEGCEHPAHLFFLIFPDLESRTQFIAHMKSRDIMTVFHYLPLEQSKFAISKDWNTQHCPVSNDLSQRLVRLPLFTQLHEGELNSIVEATTAFET